MTGAGVSVFEQASLRRVLLLVGLVIVSLLAVPWLNVWTVFVTPLGIFWIAVVLPFVIALAVQGTPPQPDADAPETDR